MMADYWWNMWQPVYRIKKWYKSVHSVSSGDISFLKHHVCAPWSEQVSWSPSSSATFWAFGPHVPQTCMESFYKKLLPCSSVCPHVKSMTIPNTGSTPLQYPGGLGNKCLHSGEPFLTTGSKTQPINPVFRNGNFETGIRILTVTWWTPLLVWNATRPAHKLLR
jgi:hypothetical protein